MSATVCPYTVLPACTILASTGLVSQQLSGAGVLQMSDKSDTELREMALASLSSEDRVAAARIETIAIIWGKDAGALLVAASALAVEADPGLRARTLLPRPGAPHGELAD